MSLEDWTHWGQALLSPKSQQLSHWHSNWNLGDIYQVPPLTKFSPVCTPFPTHNLFLQLPIILNYIYFIHIFSLPAYLSKSVSVQLFWVPVCHYLLPSRPFLPLFPLGPPFYYKTFLLTLESKNSSESSDLQFLCPKSYLFPFHAYSRCLVSLL